MSQKSLLKQVIDPGVWNERKAHRYAHILPQRVGWTIDVHNGREMIPVVVTKQRVGRRFGEYVSTTSWYNPNRQKAKTNKPE